MGAYRGAINIRTETICKSRLWGDWALLVVVGGKGVSLIMLRKTESLSSIPERRGHHCTTISKCVFVTKMITYVHKNKKKGRNILKPGSSFLQEAVPMYGCALTFETIFNRNLSVEY